MAKKQTRRSISVSRTTYERLKSFCETNNISMSQLVETRVNDFLGTSDAPGALPMAVTAPAISPLAPRPMLAPRPTLPATALNRPVESRPAPVPAPAPAPTPGAATPSTGAALPPMTSAAARFVVDPPPPIIKPRQDTAAPKPAEKRPEQIFTF